MEFLKAGEDSRRNWRAINQLEMGRRVLADAVFGLGATRANRRISNSVTPFHPFKIYQVPWSLREVEAADDWLKFRVRAGRVLEANATGTDGHDANPDEEYYPTATDILATSNCAQFWFWLELAVDGSGNTTAVVRYGANPAVSSTGNPNPWTTFPKLDAKHVPIGWVDTATRLTEQVAIVRQLLRADIILPAEDRTFCDPTTNEEVVNRTFGVDQTT